MRRRRAWNFSVSLLICGGLLCANARGDGGFERHYQSAAALYKQERYAEALRALKLAYAERPVPRLLFNMAQAHRKLGQKQEATDCYLLYLRTEPAMTPQIDAEVRGYLEELRSEAPAPSAPAPRREEPPPRAPPRIEPAVVVRAPARPPQRQGIPAGALVLAGGGVALLASGIGTGAAALVAARDLENGATFDPALQQRGKALEAAAITLDVLGGAALVAGGIWLGLWGKQRREAPPVALLPGPGGAQLLGRF